MIKITIEGFEWGNSESKDFNLDAIHRATMLQLVFDDNQRVNKEEAMDIVRSVLLPGTHPIVEWPGKAAVPSAASIYDVMVKDKIIQWRDACLFNEQEHRNAKNETAAEYHRGGTEAFNRVLDELLP